MGMTFWVVLQDRRYITASVERAMTAILETGYETSKRTGDCRLLLLILPTAVKEHIANSQRERIIKINCRGSTLPQHYESVARQTISASQQWQTTLASCCRLQHQPTAQLINPSVSLVPLCVRRRLSGPAHFYSNVHLHANSQ